MVAGMELTHGLPLIKASLTLLPAAGINTEPPCDTIPWGDLPATWWQVDYIGLLPSWEGQHFVLTVIDILAMDLPSLHAMLLPKLPSADLQNALSTVIVFYTELLQIEECTSRQNKCGNGPMLTEVTGLTISSTSLKQLT